MNAIPGPNHTVYGASSRQFPKIAATVTEMKPDKIDKTIADYAQAAKHAWNAGFSGIHLQAAEGSLPHQFLSPITNQRRDDYCFAENSGALFLQELLTAVKAAVPALILIVSLSLRDLLPGGAGLSDAIKIARTLKNDGHGLIMVSEGLKIGQPLLLHPSLDKSAADAPYAEDAHIFRNETGCRVILSGKISTPDLAINLLKRKTCDFVAVGRTLNREPLWLADHFDNKLLPWQHCLRCTICRAATTGCPDRKGVNHWHLISRI
jgi:2,4-dienoyl-CoA reductase (NADPH2)